MEELKDLLTELTKSVRPPEFPPEPVPTKVAAEVLGTDPDTLLNRMESGDLDIGIIFRSKPTRRGQKSRRSSYISPKKLYELTGY